MSDSVCHVCSRIGGGLLLLLSLLLHGCRTTEGYYLQAPLSDDEYGPAGIYEQMQYFLACLPDEEKERFEHEKNAVVVKGVPASELFAEVYRTGYRDGYAYCVITKCLYTKNCVQVGYETVHYLSFGEAMPLRKAYVQGWSDGQCEAFFEGGMRRESLNGQSENQ